MSKPVSKIENTDAQNELKEKIVDAIKLVYDPEIPVDVYELGLIYEINIFPVNNVHILMTLTSPACPSVEEIPVKSKVIMTCSPQPPYEIGFISTKFLINLL